jgi:hypothetical protein
VIDKLFRRAEGRTAVKAAQSIERAQDDPARAAQADNKTMIHCRSFRATVLRIACKRQSAGGR